MNPSNYASAFAGYLIQKSLISTINTTNTVYQGFLPTMLLESQDTFVLVQQILTHINYIQMTVLYCT